MRAHYMFFRSLRKVENKKFIFLFTCIAAFLVIAFVLPSLRSPSREQLDAIDPYIRKLKEYRREVKGSSSSGADQFDVFRLTGCAVYGDGLWDASDASVTAAWGNVVDRVIPSPAGLRCMLLTGDGDG